MNPHTLARSTDPATSHMAAQAATGFAKSQCSRIHALLITFGPSDPEQLAAMLDMEAYSVRKRLSNLQHANLAQPTGDVVPTESGRSQRVWRAL